LNLKSLNQQTVNNPREEPQIQLTIEECKDVRFIPRPFPLAKKANPSFTTESTRETPAYGGNRRYRKLPH